MDKPKHNDHLAETEREPYEAPEVRTLADVEDATMASQEFGNDALTQFS